MGNTSSAENKIFEAAIKGELGKAMHCVEKHRLTHIDFRNKDGLTPLMCACHYGHLSMVTYLVTMLKADVNLADKRGLTAVMIAAKRGQFDTVKFLVQNAACRLLVRDKRGQCLFDIGKRHPKLHGFLRRYDPDCSSRRTFTSSNSTSSSSSHGNEDSDEDNHDEENNDLDSLEVDEAFVLPGKMYELHGAENTRASVRHSVK